MEDVYRLQWHGDVVHMAISPRKVSFEEVVNGAESRKK
jgi:hypothetical protein